MTETLYREEDFSDPSTSIFWSTIFLCLLILSTSEGILSIWLLGSLMSTGLQAESCSVSKRRSKVNEHFSYIYRERKLAESSCLSLLTCCMRGFGLLPLPSSGALTTSVETFFSYFFEAMREEGTH